MIEGSCNCGQARFKVRGKVADKVWGVSNCHCGQCRKQSGNVWASAVVQQSDIEITGNVTWYASSHSARRGFCATCGCPLFWKHNTETSMSFSLGAIDGPSGLKIEKHIFVADKGDYYDIADGIPQHDH